MKKISAFSVPFGFAWTTVVLAGGAAAQTTAYQYTLAPPRAKPDSAFSLWALSESFTCASAFSHQEVKVTPSMLPIHPARGRIDLVFLETIRPDIRCAQNPGAIYGPRFRMPALKPAIYSVFAVRKHPCQFQNPPCEIPDRVEPAGTLTVDTGLTPWFIKPRQVRANARFDLEVLNEKYGNCNWAFTDSLIEPRAAMGLHLAFVIRHYPERVCVWDERPFGPVFRGLSLPGPAKIPVYVRIRRACEVERPPCLPGPERQELVDTLIVTAPTSLAPRIRLRPSAMPFLRGEYLLNGRKERPALKIGEKP